MLLPAIHRILNCKHQEKLNFTDQFVENRTISFLVHATMLQKQGVRVSF
uniref:Uncharacterized protein n=1 Tax=Arundo donax TaxID=35708 RepID=A0A0A9CI57_ARUDO